MDPIPINIRRVKLADIPARRPVPQSTEYLVEILRRLNALADAVDDLTTLVIAEIARRERGG